MPDDDIDSIQTLLSHSNVLSQRLIRWSGVYGERKSHRIESRLTRALARTPRTQLRGRGDTVKSGDK